MANVSSKIEVLPVRFIQNLPIKLMSTLFPVPPVLPEGFLYFPDFLSETEEMSLLSDIREIALHPFKFQGFEAKRKVASFGYDYNFSDKALLKGAEIPPVFNAFSKKWQRNWALKRKFLKKYW